MKVTLRSPEGEGTERAAASQALTVVTRGMRGCPRADPVPTVRIAVTTRISAAALFRRCTREAK
jgi:hypothetical protein